MNILYDYKTWFNDPEGIIDRTIRRFVFFLCENIYGLMIKLYDLFMQLSRTRLLNSEALKLISQKIGLILGIIMLLRVMFSFIQMLIDPDLVSDKEKGAVGLIKKIILVVIMLGISTSFFNLIFDLQVMVIDRGIISSLILPSVPTINNQDLLSSGKTGGFLAEELFNISYNVRDFESNDITIDSNGTDAIDDCKKIHNALRQQIFEKGDFTLGKTCISSTVDIEIADLQNGGTTKDQAFIMNFNIILALLSGIACLYFIFNYCIKVGMRMMQLMILEIISPMAIVSYLSPNKENMFTKWSKIYISTYIDVFIRIAIINFIILLITALFGTLPGYNSYGGFDFWKNLAIAPTEQGMIIIIMIMALLSFAKNAPELIKELLPASASKLGFGASMKDMLGVQVVTGAAAGGLVGGAVGFLGGNGIGAIGGIFRGARNSIGAKGIGEAISKARKAQAEHNVAARNGQLPGLFDSISSAVGGSTTKERYDNQIKEIEDIIAREKETVAVQRRQTAAYQQVADKKSSWEDRAKEKLVKEDFSDPSKAALAALQRNVTLKQAEIDTAEKIDTSKMSAAQKKAHAANLARLREEYNQTLKENAKRYISAVYQDNSLDRKMANEQEDLRNLFTMNPDGAFNGMNTTINDYDDLDTFEGATTRRMGDNNRIIAQSDNRVAQHEGRIESIKSSVGYQRASRQK